MAYSFNVFSGTLDQVGSSAVVFEGEVETFADLPEAVGDPAVGASYLVRTSTGVWLVNRRQAGIWIRRNNTGVRATDWEYGGDYPVNSVAGKTGNVTLTNSDISGLGTAATKDAPASGNASSTQVVLGSDTRLSDARTPTSHTHPSTDITGLGTFATANAATPPAIGSTTPAAGSFTNLLASAELTVPAVTPASPSAGDLYRNADTLRYRDSTNTERTLLSGAGNLANLTDTATARTNLGVGSSDAVTFGSIQNTPIGSTTASSGAFTTLSATPAAGSTALTLTGGTVTASVPVMSVTQTWNNAAGSFTTAEMRTSVTAGNGYLFRIFAGSTGTTERFRVAADGEVNAGVTLTVAGAGGGIGSPNFSIGNQNHWRSGSNGALVWTDTANNAYAGTNDLFVLRDAAGTLGQRNAANAQTYRIYNTFTDTNNYERGFMRWSSNVLQIGTEKGGTGSARNLELLTDNVWRGRFQSEGLLLNSNGPRVYFGSPLISGDGESGFSLDLQPFGSGNVIIRSGLLKMNGTTSSFPALKRSSTTLQVRLADDSAFAPLECGNITVNGTTNGTVGSAVGLLLSAASTNNITFQTNSTLRWTIGGSSGALVSENGIPIRFGGSTSSFPRLVNSGAVLQCSLADGSAYAVFEALFRAQGTAPATSGATGTAGDIRYDADYIYVCTATNTWKRAAIATW